MNMTRSPKARTVADVRIGQIIRTCRLAAEVTQQELGNSIGVTFQQIQKYENGSNRISASRLKAVSEVLNVSLPDLFDCDPGLVPLVASSRLTPLAEEDRLLLSAFQKLENVAVRKAVLSFVRSLAGNKGPVG